MCKELHILRIVIKYLWCENTSCSAAFEETTKSCDFLSENKKVSLLIILSDRIKIIISVLLFSSELVTHAAEEKNLWIKNKPMMFEESVLQQLKT